MSVRIDLVCTRCGRKTGTAKVSVPLNSLNYTLEAQSNMAPLIVDEDDRKYWSDRHSRKECDARIDENRAKHDAAMLDRERNFELPISVS